MAGQSPGRGPAWLGTGPSSRTQAGSGRSRGYSRERVRRGDLDVGCFNGRAGNPRSKVFVQDASVFYIGCILL